MLRLIRTILVVSCVSVIMLIVALDLLFLENQATVELAPPPTPQDVSAARQLIREIRNAASLRPEENNPPLVASVEQFNSVIRLGARFIPDARGRLWISGDKLEGAASLPVPWITGRKWLNIRGTVPPFNETFRLERITIGNREVPPALAILAMRTGANLIAGDQFGDKVLQSASAMRIDDNSLLFDISLDEVGRNGVMRGTFGMLRGAQMPSAEEVDFFHRHIREAMARGELPPNGSFLPYLDFTLSAVQAHSTPQTLPNVYTAAIFGLAKACGARDFSMIVGRLAFDDTADEENWPVSCDEVVFNRRIDSRRHFITSAALQAASNRGFAISIGEFKELYDTISGAGGFDFTDMAANLSGIRMSNTLMTLPLENWPERMALIETENDVIISFDDIPQLMPEEDFKARFHDVESPAYKAMLARIETRIDGLRLHRGL